MPEFDKKHATLVLGATTNEERYANIAMKLLAKKGFMVRAVGLKSGFVEGIEIHDNLELFDDIQTVTLYVGAKNQPPYYDYIMNLKPERIIFNPGTENHELVELAESKGIKTEYACTLVLLNLNQY